MINVRRVVQHSAGAGATVSVEQLQVPAPGRHEVLVELAFAPIHPAELLMLQGDYGYGDSKPTVPRNAGIEGVGVVVGGATDEVPVGTPVALIGIDGIWSDYFVLPVEGLLRLPVDGDLQQLSMAIANPLSALLLLSDFVELSAGDWVIQNAANSAFGRVVEAVCAGRGVNVVNVVRSAAAAALIADARVVEIAGPDLEERVRAQVGDRLPELGIDAIGGPATGELARCLAPGGVVACCGLLSGRPCEVPTELVVFHGITVQGFLTQRSMGRRTPEQQLAVRDEALRLVTDSTVRMPVEQVYRLDAVTGAIEHAERPGRTGKILLTR